MLLDINFFCLMTTVEKSVILNDINLVKAVRDDISMHFRLVFCYHRWMRREDG